MTTHGSVGCIPRASRYFYPCLDSDGPRPRENETVLAALTLKPRFELDPRKLARDLDEMLSWSAGEGWVHRHGHLLALYDVVGWRPLDHELDSYPQFGPLHYYAIPAVVRYPSGEYQARA